MKNWLTLLLILVGGIAFANSRNATPNALRLRILPDKDTLFVCADSSITLEANGGVNYQWSPANIVNLPTAAKVKVKPTQNIWVYVDGFVNGIKQRDSVFLVIVRPSIALQALDPQSVCRGVPVRLLAVTNTQGQGITWTPAAGLSSTSAALVTARPSFTTTYQATVNVTGCKASASISVNIAPQRADIQNPDTVFACKGTKPILFAITSTGSPNNLTWTASDKSINVSNVINTTVQPKITTKYFATFITSQCTTVDSVVVVIDSLPVQTITIDPQKEVYCQGEILILKSDVFESRAYPFIKHKWGPLIYGPNAPKVDFQTPDSLWNLVIGTIDSIYLIRATKNRGCVDTARILVPVIKPKVITIVPEKPILCPGQSVQLIASYKGEGTIKWGPATATLSCTDCKTPTVTPLATTTFTITVTEKNCPSSASREVQVLLAPTLGLANNPVVCKGGSVLINTSADPATTYRWTGPNGFTSNIGFLSVSPDVTSTYTVTAQRGNCTAVTRDVTVTVIQPATVTVPADQTICPNTSVTLTAAGNAPAGVNQTYTWRYAGQTSNQVTVTASNVRSNTRFDLTYTWGPNCGTITRSVNVNVFTVPSITGFTFDPADAATKGIPLGNSIKVIANTSPAVPNGVTYTWFANDQPITGNTLTIQHSPTANPTVYKLRITTATSNCVVEANTLPIPVLAPTYDIPNAFTPNGDNRNDFFNVVYSGNVEIVDFQVFNRWGQQVYNNSNNKQGWDGTNGGQPAPSDVFLYKIIVRYPDGTTFNRSGEVTLIR